MAAFGYCILVGEITMLYSGEVAVLFWELRKLYVVFPHLLDLAFCIVGEKEKHKHEICV